MGVEDILDTTKPNVARIYDYILGGKHNFPADRTVAKQMAKAMPFAAQSINLNRWFVEYAGRTMHRAGLTQFLDLGAGLPSADALHSAVAPDARVLYVDNDPDTVTYGQYILREELGNPPQISYIQGRIEELAPVLTAAEEFLETKQPIGICLIGVTWFLDDEALRQAARQLYDWAAPGSILAVTGGDPARENISDDPAIQSYQRRTETHLFMRPVAELLPLLPPWQGLDPGMQPFEFFAEGDIGARLVGLDFRGKVGFGGFFQRSA